MACKFLNWRPLVLLGMLFWVFLCLTDPLSESTWKKYSSKMGDILSIPHSDTAAPKLLESALPNTVSVDSNSTITSISSALIFVLWNGTAFIGSMFFFGTARYVLANIWHYIKAHRQTVIRQGFLKLKELTNRNFQDLRGMEFNKIRERFKPQTTANASDKCQILFRNASFNWVNEKHELKSKLNAMIKVINEAHKENSFLTEQLMYLQQDSNDMKKQLETMKTTEEKFRRTTDILRVMTQDFEMTTNICRKLEQKVQDVARERDNYRDRVCKLENEIEKLKRRLEEIVEKDECQRQENLRNLTRKHSGISIDKEAKNVANVDKHCSEPHLQNCDDYAKLNNAKPRNLVNVLKSHLSTLAQNLEEGEETILNEVNGRPIAEHTIPSLLVDDDVSDTVTTFRTISSTTMFQNFIKRMRFTSPGCNNM